MDGPVLEIRLEPSRVLWRALIALHLAAVAAPWLSGAGLAPRILLSLAALCALGCLLRERRGAGPVVLRAGASGWSLEQARVQRAVEVLPGTTIWPWMIVLRLRTPQGTRTLLAGPGSAPPDALRALRLALRLGGDQAGRGVSTVSAGRSSIPG